MIEKLSAILNLNNSKDREMRAIEQRDEMIDLLKRIERSLRPIVSEATVIELEVETKTKDGQIIGVGNMANLKLGQTAKISVKAIKDAEGNPAQVEGNKLNWGVSGDQSLGTLTPSEDGMSAEFVRAAGTVGTCTVEVSGDADLGPDVKTIIGTAELVCLGGEAVTFELDVQVNDAAPVDEEPVEPTPEV